MPRVAVDSFFDCHVLNTAMEHADQSCDYVVLVHPYVTELFEK